MADKKPKYKAVQFTKAELKAAWLACSNYTPKSNSAKELKAQTRATHKLQLALLNMLL